MLTDSRLLDLDYKWKFHQYRHAVSISLRRNFRTQSHLQLGAPHVEVSGLGLVIALDMSAQSKVITKKTAAREQYNTNLETKKAAVVNNIASSYKSLYNEGSHL